MFAQVRRRKVVVVYSSESRDMEGKGCYSVLRRDEGGVTIQDVVNWRNKLSKARDFENEKPRKIKG